jgi:hypothetical protein
VWGADLDRTGRLKFLSAIRPVRRTGVGGRLGPDGSFEIPIRYQCDKTNPHLISRRSAHFLPGSIVVMIVPFERSGKMRSHAL